MTQQIQFDGQLHQFPDNFSQSDIQSALSSYPADKQSAMPATAQSGETGDNNGLGTQLGLTARYAAEGLAAPLNMVGNAANSAINLMLPDKYKLGMPSDTTSQLLTQAGLPNPQGPQQRIVGDMSRAVASLGTGMGLGNLLSDAAPAVSTALTQNPLMQARGAVGAAGAGGSAQELGAGPLGQIMASMAGGYGTTRTPFTSEPDQASLSEGLRSDASQAFKDAKTSGAVFNQESSSQLPSEIEANLANTGKMNARLHGDTLSVLDDMKNDPDINNLSLEDLHQYRQLFGQAVNNNLHPNGALKPDAMKANQAIDVIDNLINDAKNNPQAHLATDNPDALASFQKGMDLWSKSARANDIERIMDRADMMDQPATALRTGFKTLASNPKRMRGFSDEDQDLIRKAADISMPVDVLRSLGSRLIGVIAAGTGNLGGSLMAQGGSAVSRNLATQAQMNRAQDILDSIAKPNNLMQSLPDISKQMGMMNGIIPQYQYGGQQ